MESQRRTLSSIAKTYREIPDSALWAEYNTLSGRVTVIVASIHGVIGRELADRYTACKEEMERRHLLEA